MRALVLDKATLIARGKPEPYYRATHGGISLRWPIELAGDLEQAGIYYFTAKDEYGHRLIAEVFVNDVNSVNWKERYGRCEDAPCCGCCD